MHHPVSAIDSLIHSVSLASHVSTHLLIHLSAHLCHHHHSHHPSLLHSFTAGSKPAFSANPSHLNTPLTLDCLHDHGTGPDLSCFSIYFWFVFFFNFSVCSVWWTKLAGYTSAFYCTLKRHYQYHIVLFILQCLADISAVSTAHL